MKKSKTSGTVKEKEKERSDLKQNEGEAAWDSLQRIKGKWAVCVYTNGDGKGAGDESSYSRERE